MYSIKYKCFALTAFLSARSDCKLRRWLWDVIYFRYWLWVVFYFGSLIRHRHTLANSEQSHSSLMDGIKNRPINYH